MPKMTYQRPRPIQQPRTPAGSKPPIGPVPAGRKQPKPAPDTPGPAALPPLRDLLDKIK
jgi:hypothetical protein